jgi:glutamate transport system ATP-binding protein
MTVSDTATSDNPHQRGTDDALVVLDHVDKHFGDLHVLRDINVSIKRGEVVVVIGPSGSGKSTLCRTINRLETIDGGTISLNGVPLPEEGKELAALRAEVGMVFQSFNLFAHKTILENVTLGLTKVRKTPKKSADELAMNQLKRVGVAEQAGKYPAQLSGGQQQRVAIARALAMEPEVVLFDEPTSALDPKLVREVGVLLRSLDDLRKTLVVVSHDMDFARAISDQVIYFEGGRAVESGTVAEVFGNPQQPETRSFMASFQERS